MYCTTYSAYARGGLIWVRQGVPFQLARKVCDPEGQYVMMVGQLEGSDIALLNVYAPNVNQSHHFPLG